MTKHDLKYQTARNALIPEAEIFANLTAGVRPPGTDPNRPHDDYNRKWNQAF